MSGEPYWVRYHREKQAHEAAIRMSVNPPPPKATGIVPVGAHNDVAAKIRVGEVRQGFLR